MAWQLKGSPKTQRVTPKLAKEFAEMDAAHVDRPLSERRLVVYRKVLQDGGFRPVAWAKAWCKETGQYYRVNGKHTSTLFSSVPAADLDVYAVVEEYECDTLEDVAKLYSTFDSQSQTRNAGDVNRSFAAVIPELRDFDLRLVNLCVGALNFAAFPVAHGGGGGTPRDGTMPGAPLTAAERAEVLFDNVEVCLWLASVITDRSNKHKFLARVPVMAAMVGCWRKSRKDANEFWTAVRDETGEKPTLPDRKLARWLLDMRVRQGSTGATPVRFRPLPREFYVRCIHAWNAWRRKETTELKYYPAAKLPTFA